MTAIDGSHPGSDAGRSAGQRVDVPFLIVLGVGAILRLVSLDYSHFQGDEVKALYPANEAFPGFLLAQKKGPTQFLVTWLVHQITGGYAEWVTRLPFALASIATIVVIYRLTLEHWGRPVARLSAALFAVCGLLVAFGRIAQYQSFCLLFVALTAHFMLRALRPGSTWPIYAGLVSYAFGVLTHYDVLTFGPTLAILAWGGYSRRRGAGERYLRHFGFASLVAVLAVAIFYVPYVLRPGFAEVRSYLMTRVAAGHGTSVFGATSDLLGLYLPPLYLPFVGAFIVLGGGALAFRRPNVASVSLLVWFVSVFAFYMFLGGDPRSHVYAYFTPGLILAAYGMHVVVRLFQASWARVAIQAAVWGIVSGIGAATYLMLVDHTIEHPWFAKRVFGYAVPNLETRVVEGVFGFPYQRGLDQVGARFDAGEFKGTFGSNERDVMADYYFRSTRSSRPDYYFYVHRPLSLDRELPAFVTAEYHLAGQIWTAGRPTIDIYERGRRDAVPSSELR